MFFTLSTSASTPRKQIVQLPLAGWETTKREKPPSRARETKEKESERDDTNEREGNKRVGRKDGKTENEAGKDTQRKRERKTSKRALRVTRPNKKKICETKRT